MPPAMEALQMAARQAQRPLSSVEGKDMKTYKIGRPSKLNAEVRNSLIIALSAGCSQKDACAHAGISKATFSRWMAKGQEDEAAGRRSEYRDFLDLVQRAHDRAKPRLEILMAKHAEKSYRAALTILERRYPEEWGRRVISSNPDAGRQVVNGIMGRDDPEFVLIELLKGHPEIEREFFRRLEMLDKCKQAASRSFNLQH